MCVCVCECATCGRVKRFTANQLQLRSFAALIASGSSSCRVTLCRTLPGTLLTLRRQPKTENENKISRRWTLDGQAEELLCDLAKMLGIYHERFVRRFSLVLAPPEGEWRLPGHVCIAHFLLQSKLMCWPFNYTTNKQQPKNFSLVTRREVVLARSLSTASKDLLRLETALIVWLDRSLYFRIAKFI